MITNWAEGSKEAGPLEQIFHVAVQHEEPRPRQPDLLLQTLTQQSLPLVQDLHLLDAETEAGDNNIETGSTQMQGPTVETH